MAAAHAAARSSKHSQGFEGTAFGKLVKTDTKRSKSLKQVVGLVSLANRPKESCMYQSKVRELYETPTSQIGVAGLIFANFIVSAVQSQIMPGKDPDPWSVFFVFEWFFGLIFTVELVWNMYGSWPLQFWKSGWNLFDFVIVIISLLALVVPDLPGIAVLRLFRAFRVFRLFKRIESLKLIIDGVMASLPGVFNAFLVLGILMGIWSIMGVEFFGTVAEEEFGTFLKGMFSMWQITTMDSWASGIARPIIYGDTEPPMPFAAIYFISFVFVAGVIMTNVVVAILLEKYLDATSNAASEKENLKAPTPEQAMKKCERDLVLLQRLLRMRVIQQDPIKLAEFNLRVKLKEDELADFEKAYLATIDLPPLPSVLAIDLQDGAASSKTPTSLKLPEAWARSKVVPEETTSPSQGTSSP